VEADDVIQVTMTYEHGDRFGCYLRKEVEELVDTGTGIQNDVVLL